tara:strand:- start:2418 stop:2612 length:195 start_codon:yes stop_codon:yes gene_type:complete
MPNDGVENLIRGEIRRDQDDDKECPKPGVSVQPPFYGHGVFDFGKEKSDPVGCFPFFPFSPEAT